MNNQDSSITQFQDPDRQAVGLAGLAGLSPAAIATIVAMATAVAALVNNLADQGVEPFVSLAAAFAELIA